MASATSRRVTQGTLRTASGHVLPLEHTAVRVSVVGGASDVLVPGEEGADTLARFARRVAAAGPVLRDLKIYWEAAQMSDSYQRRSPICTPTSQCNWWGGLTAWAQASSW